MRYRLAFALTAFVSAPALADTSLPPAHPRLEYRSVLADFMPYREVGLADWQAVNDTVQRLGGHMGHAQTPTVGQRPGGRDAADGSTTERAPGNRP